MGLYWRDCFLCASRGKLTIGDNFNNFHKPKDKECPFCHGSGQVPLKITYSESFKNRIRGKE